MATTFYAFNIYVADGVSKVFNITFANGYISTADVVAESTTDLVTFTNLPIQSVVGSVVTLVSVPPAGTNIIIKRDTEKNFPLVNYSDGAILNETNLDLSNAQAIDVAAEAFDAATFSQLVAQSAVGSANAAVSTAQDALNAANAASSAATTAQNTADDALELATQANLNVSSAILTANDALDAANAALPKAAAPYTLALTGSGFSMSGGTGTLFNLNDTSLSFLKPVALPSGSTIGGAPIAATNVVHITASGGWLVPAGVTQVTLDALGGGGSGGNGGGSTSGSTNGGSGGAAGLPGSYQHQVKTVVPGETLTVSIGAGGLAPALPTAGTVGANGNTGGSTTVIGTTSGALLTATGGAGGAGGGLATGTALPDAAQSTVGIRGFWDSRGSPSQGGIGQGPLLPYTTFLEQLPNYGVNTVGPVAGGAPDANGNAGSIWLITARGSSGGGGSGAGRGATANRAGGQGAAGRDGYVRITY